MIHRILEQLVKNDFNSGKMITIMGARQVGKTTLLESMVAGQEGVLRFNCDNYDDRSDLENKTSTELRQLVGDSKIVIIDEAQRVKNIGLTNTNISDGFVIVHPCQ